MQSSVDVQVEQTRGMVDSSVLVLERLGWDSVKEFVVYGLREGNWEPGSVWDSLAHYG